MEGTFSIVSTETLELLLNSIKRVEKLIADVPEYEKVVYTEEEVSELFGVTKKTLAKYRNEGKLGFVKPDNGRVILYKKEHIKDFLEKYEYKAFK